MLWRHDRDQVNNETGKTKYPRWYWGLHRLLAYFIEPVKNLCRGIMGYMVDVADGLSDVQTDTAEISNRLANVEKALTTLLKAQESDMNIIKNDLSIHTNRIRRVVVDQSDILKNLIELKKQIRKNEQDMASADVIDYTEEKAATDRVIREMKEDGVKDEDIEAILTGGDREEILGK